MSPSQSTTTTTTANGIETRAIYKNVFDVQKFDDVKLTRKVELPTKPATLEEALAAVGNDKDALLAVIHDGLIERTMENARNQNDGWLVVPEEGEATETYTGQPVTEEKGKAINGAVLNLAKAAGYSKDLAPEKKRALKEQAMQLLRSNPPMLQFIINQATPASSETPTPTVSA